MSERELVVRWTDAAIARRAISERRLSGLEFLRAMARGEIPRPPIGELLGFELEEVEPGRVVFGLQPDHRHDNPNGVVHGGVPATLLDTATGCAVQTLLGFGETCATLEIKVNFMRSLSASSPRVRCIGTVLHRGRRSAVAEGRLVLPDDRLVAHATSTLLLLSPEEGHSGERTRPAGGPSQSVGTPPR